MAVIRLFFAKTNMHKFDTFLVCLDLSNKDRQVLSHASILVKSLQPKKLVFFHSLFTDGEDAGNGKSYDQALSQLSNRIADWFEAGESLETEYFVCEGRPIEEIVEYAKESNVDLVLCGKSTSKHHHDLLPHKIARKAPCSVLLLPHNSQLSFNHILVASDQSEHSRQALCVASRILARRDDAKIVLVEAIDMPYGSQMSIGANRFVDLRESATEQLEKFADASGMDEVVSEVVIASNVKASKAILEVARKRSAAMIVMGSKGKGAVAATILGSTVENVASSTVVPLLIVKSVKRNSAD